MCLCCEICRVPVLEYEHRRHASILIMTFELKIFEKTTAQNTLCECECVFGDKFQDNLCKKLWHNYYEYEDMMVQWRFEEISIFHHLSNNYERRQQIMIKLYNFLSLRDVHKSSHWRFTANLVLYHFSNKITVKARECIIFTLSHLISQNVPRFHNRNK